MSITNPKLLTAVGIVLLLGACSPVERQVSVQASGEKPISPVEDVARSAATVSDQTEVESTEVLSSSVSGKPQSGKLKKVLRPVPMNMPFEATVEVAAEVTPLCVTPGSTVTVNVVTEPGAPLAYQAIYAGNQSGSEPPFGEGYGGNAKGFASDDGTYTDTWIVRLDAPRGPARLDVVVGWEGEFGYTAPRFAVADKDGNCPQKWLRGGDE